MMIDYFLNIVTVLLTAFISSAITYIVNNRFKKKSEESAEYKEKVVAFNDAVICLLRVQMIEYHDKYCAKGSIPSYVLENYEHLFKAYTALGGNGMMKRMHSEVLELPVNI